MLLTVIPCHDLQPVAVLELAKRGLGRWGNPTREEEEEEDDMGIV
jgi:hypothetical protein